MIFSTAEGRRYDRAYLLVVLMLALAYTSLASYLSILQHHALRTQLRDLGHYVQSLYQITQGDFLMTLSHPHSGVSRLAEHRDFVLYLLAPLFFIWPKAELLLIIQSFCIGLGSILIYFLARSHSLSAAISLLFSLLLLLSPFIHSANLYDFHSVTLSVLFIPMLLLSIERKNLTWTIVSLTLLLSLKEDMALLAIFLAPFICVRWSAKIALCAATASLLVFAINWWGLPWYFGWKHSSPHWFRYSYLGETPLDLLQNAFLAPGVFIERVLEPVPLQYLLLIGICSLPLAIFAPYALLMAIPNIAQNVLDKTDFQARITTVYYSAVVITAVVCASIYGYKFLLRKNRRLAQFSLSLFAATQILLCLILSPAPHSLTSSWADFKSYYDRNKFLEITSLIPKDAALSTQNNLGAQFAAREFIFEYPENLEKADYVLIFMGDPTYYDNGLFMRSAGFYLGRSSEKFWEKLTRILENPEWGVYGIAPPFYLFKRAAPRDKVPEVRRMIWQDHLRLLQKRAENKKQYFWLLNADWLRKAADSQSFPTLSLESGEESLPLQAP